MKKYLPIILAVFIGIGSTLLVQQGIHRGRTHKQRLTSEILKRPRAQDPLPDTAMHRPFVLWPAEQPLPTEGYDRDPQVPFAPSDLVIQPNEMRPFYGPPGEFGYYIDGVNYGFKSLSFILTETHPGGGPDLHSHDTEEAHILFDGKVTYLVGDKRFTVEGPYITRVPAGVPHTFINAGAKPFHLIAVFPDGRPVYRHIGHNPLIPAADPGLPTTSTDPPER
jgi:mannose-6-phosphate isomerase-like protein (cupin superfamily)